MTIPEINKKKLLEIREQIQNDLICLLDPLEIYEPDKDRLKDQACQIIVDNFNKLNLDDLILDKSAKESIS